MSYPKTKELKEHLEWLEKEGIIKVTTGEGFVFTPSGQQICKSIGYYPEPSPVFDVVKIDQQIERIRNLKPADWQQLFITFIMEAKIPKQAESSNGDVYALNKFSAGALKVFQKAMSDGVIYDILVKSTMLYYKSNVKLKKSIGNYFIQGDWLSDYINLRDSAAGGIESLSEHIKSETHVANQSAWKLG
jgi:hypothetical protein